MEQVYSVYDDRKGIYTDAAGNLTNAGWWKVLGFRPVDEKEEMRREQWDWQQRVRHELGHSPGKGDIWGNP
jgi:hypothetical protein